MRRSASFESAREVIGDCQPGRLLSQPGELAREVVGDCQPGPVLSQPGELRREYEEEIRKMEAERQASKEEENKASEEYIQKLLAEEEEEEEEKLWMETRRSEMEEQLKDDEDLSLRLSISSNDNYEKSPLASPSSSRKSDAVTNKSQNENTNTQKDVGHTQKYLSPKLKSGSAWPGEEDKSCMSKESPVGQDTHTEKDMPALSPKICLETQEQASESLAESPVLWSCAMRAEQSLQGTVETLPTNRDDEATVKPSGKIENEEGSVSGVTQLAGGNRAPESRVVGKEIYERENQDSVFEAVMDPCSSAKRSKVFLKLSDPEEKEVSFKQKLIDLEHRLFERHKQEEQDRLFALQLQKELDKEQKTVNRRKGTPDQYQLRTSSAPDRLLGQQRKNSKDRTS
ncbi:E3 ubiquitin-protein ligase RNF168-like [Mesocricetus auratus]|uniref:RING-type E3 ubiquitin transferase n=1 Tax=Mesocricetus auratus TaxID=10036 RepID=A0ABM2XAT1_MESAU|nr:E3 ubiquitin-protein ligase RNF168-like [Mesocricetus auratus]